MTATPGPSNLAAAVAALAEAKDWDDLIALCRTDREREVAQAAYSVGLTDATAAHSAHLAAARAADHADGGRA